MRYGDVAQRPVLQSLGLAMRHPYAPHEEHGRAFLLCFPRKPRFRLSRPNFDRAWPILADLGRSWPSLAHDGQFWLAWARLGATWRTIGPSSAEVGANLPLELAVDGGRRPTSAHSWPHRPICGRLRLGLLGQRWPKLGRSRPSLVRFGRRWFELRSNLRLQATLVCLRPPFWATRAK